jgi:adenosine deaminase
MNRDVLRSLPKAELHNHLDGGLRVDTVLELAAEIGYRRLPKDEPEALADWFNQGGSGSLENYLASFDHTIAVIQTAKAIERVAFEAAEDLAADGVIYAEIRFAPILNTAGGLRREEALEAALSGFRRAMDTYDIVIGLIVDAMRNLPDSLSDALAAIRYVDEGVVGFDLAGPEIGYPPDRHLPACRLAREYGLGLTIHAGEADGPHSIHRAIAKCGAQRIGHGIQIMADVTDGMDGPRLGGVAALVRDRQIPLEICPRSNMHTLGLAPQDHPLGKLRRLGFNVTLNTDNRLMSRVSLTDEFLFAVDHHDFDQSDLHCVTIAALDAAFVDHQVRQQLVSKVNAAYTS